MSTLYILVEGDTEFAVVKRFLQPYWHKRFSKCEVINYKGSGNLKARYVRDIKRILAVPNQAVLVLLDIKNDPFDIQDDAFTIADAYQTLQQRLYAGLAMHESDNLGIFPVVVEIETWLLADPTLQRDVLGQTFTHPENIVDPADVIKRYVRNYHKGEGARQLFEKANAIQVYEDNCPHFIYLADWLQGALSEEIVSKSMQPSSDLRTQIATLQKRYDELSQTIEANLKRGQTAAAGVLKIDRDYIEQQIRDLLLNHLQDNTDT